MTPVLAVPILADFFDPSSGGGAHLALIGGILVAFATVTRPVWISLYRAFHRTNEFLDDWFGEKMRPGQPERPGAMARLAQLESNGGSSMRDSVNRMEVTLDAVAEKAEQAVIAAGLAVNEAKVGRAVMSEAHDRNVADLAETRALVAELSERQHEQAEVATVQRGLIDHTIARTAEALRAELAAHMQVQPHTHDVSMSHPVEDTHETP